MLKLVRNPNIDIVEEASTGLANIAGSNARERDLITEAGAVNLLSNVLEHGPKKHSFVLSVSNALAQLCGGNPSPKLSVVKRALPPLTEVLNNNDDEKMLYDILYPLEQLIWKSNPETR